MNSLQFHNQKLALKKGHRNRMPFINSTTRTYVFQRSFKDLIGEFISCSRIFKNLLPIFTSFCFHQKLVSENSWKLKKHTNNLICFKSSFKDLIFEFISCSWIFKIFFSYFHKFLFSSKINPRKSAITVESRFKKHFGNGQKVS